MELSEQQSAALKVEAQKAFETRAASDVRQHIPPRETAHLSETELLARVSRAARRARQHGLETQRQAIGYIYTSFLLGENFESHPDCAWAKEVLASTNLSPTDKSNLLVATSCSVYAERQPDRDG
ncbi:MAG: hypothetical protein KF708_00780 [Pirellulales bacterium]|nr:hypothetical protein [Pirellulales bacterium]